MSRLIFEGDTTKRFGEKFPKPFIEEVRAYDNGMEVDIAFYFKVPNDDDSVASFLANLKNEEKFSQSIVLSAIDGRTLNRLKITKNFETLMKNQLDLNLLISDSERGLTKTKIITFSDFLNGLETPSTMMVSAFSGRTLGGFRVFDSVEAELPAPSSPFSTILEGADFSFGSEPTFESTGPVTSLTERLSRFTPFASDSGRPPTMYQELDLYTSPIADGRRMFLPSVSHNVGVKDDFYSLEGIRYMKVFGTLEIEYNSSGEMYITCFVKNN